MYQTDFSTSPAVGAAGTGTPFQVAQTFATCNPFIVQSAHTVLMVGLGDGSVRSVAETVSVTTWSLACIPNDGTPLGSDW